MSPKAAVALEMVGFENNEPSLVDEQISVVDHELKELLPPYLKVGRKIELKFPEYYNSQSLFHLQELHRDKAVSIDELGVRFIVAVSEKGQSHRPARPVTIELMEGFFQKPVHMKTFFNRLCPQLAFIRLLPD